MYKSTHKETRIEITSNLSKAHETRDSLAVPVRKLSWSISIHFVAIHFWNLHAPQLQIAKNTKTTYFGDSRSFKVIDVDSSKKLVTIACYDNSMSVPICNRFYSTPANSGNWRVAVFDANLRRPRWT